MEWFLKGRLGMRGVDAPQSLRMADLRSFKAATRGEWWHQRAIAVACTNRGVLLVRRGRRRGRFGLEKEKAAS